MLLPCDVSQDLGSICLAQYKGGGGSWQTMMGIDTRSQQTLGFYYDTDLWVIDTRTGGRHTGRWSQTESRDHFSALTHLCLELWQNKWNILPAN